VLAPDVGRRQRRQAAQGLALYRRGWHVGSGRGHLARSGDAALRLRRAQGERSKAPRAPHRQRSAAAHLRVDDVPPLVGVGRVGASGVVRLVQQVPLERGRVGRSGCRRAQGPSPGKGAFRTRARCGVLRNAAALSRGCHAAQCGECNAGRLDFMAQCPKRRQWRRRRSSMCAPLAAR
jgi:hypothetical protein